MFRKRKDDDNNHVNGISGSGSGDVNVNNTSKVLIQRLIIFHDGLMPLPNNKTKTQHVIKQRRNPQLSENASLDEHGEFILYYYDHSLHFTKEGTRRDKQPPEPNQGNTRRTVSDLSDTTTTKTNTTDYATEEAVRFVGD